MIPLGKMYPALLVLLTLACGTLTFHIGLYINIQRYLALVEIVVFFRKFITSSARHPTA